MSGSGRDREGVRMSGARPGSAHADGAWPRRLLVLAAMAFVGLFLVLPLVFVLAGALEKGVARVAQKVGEEGVELALAGVGDTNEKVVEESADLLFHLLVLLRARGVSLASVVAQLEARHRT